MKLELIKVDTKHDCPEGAYANNCDGLNGSCLQCGMTKQLAADQLA